MLTAHGGFNGGGCIEQSATRHRFSFHIFILRSREPSAKIGRRCLVAAAVFVFSSKRDLVPHADRRFE
jgi:hypothetical protein